ncbi:hypothetical protein [Methylobacterium oryzae]|uniref:hypothetical protein n=1 Tax=Methylobacterium oryzae TaxID=334852 RepID=UPI002F31C1E3
MTDRQTGRTAMKFSVVALHIWGSMIVYSATFGDRSAEDIDALAALLNPIGWGIAACLVILSGDKQLQNLIAARFGIQRVEETTTKTVQTAPAVESKGESVQ